MDVDRQVVKEEDEVVEKSDVLGEENEESRGGYHDDLLTSWKRYALGLWDGDGIVAHWASITRPGVASQHWQHVVNALLQALVHAPCLASILQQSTITPHMSDPNNVVHPARSQPHLWSTGRRQRVTRKAGGATARHTAASRRCSWGSCTP